MLPPLCIVVINETTVYGLGIGGCFLFLGIWVCNNQLVDISHRVKREPVCGIYNI